MSRTIAVNTNFIPQSSKENHVTPRGLRARFRAGPEPRPSVPTRLKLWQDFLGGRLAGVRNRLELLVSRIRSAFIGVHRRPSILERGFARCPPRLSPRAGSRNCEPALRRLPIGAQDSILPHTPALYRTPEAFTKSLQFCNQFELFLG